MLNDCTFVFTHRPIKNVCFSPSCPSCPSYFHDANDANDARKQTFFFSMEHRLNKVAICDLRTPFKTYSIDIYSFNNAIIVLSRYFIIVPQCPCLLLMGQWDSGTRMYNTLIYRYMKHTSNVPHSWDSGTLAGRPILSLSIR